MVGYFFDHGDRRGVVPQPSKWEAEMLKMIVATALVVVITSTSALAGIVLTHAAFARTSTMNSGVLVDEAQSFRMAARAPIAFDW